MILILLAAIGGEVVLRDAIHRIYRFFNAVTTHYHAWAFSGLVTKIVILAILILLDLLHMLFAICER